MTAYSHPAQYGALGQDRAMDAGGVRIVHNRLLGGWYVVRGPHDTPISGRFDSKEEAQASLNRGRDDAQDDLAKTVSASTLRQKVRDGEWEVSVDLEPAIYNRRAIEVRDTETNRKFWVRT